MFNIDHLLKSNSHWVSLLIVGAIVFLESGIPIGFFLPGDTMLFTAGFFAAQHYLPLGALLIVAVVAKLLGSSCGYLIGFTAGRKLFRKPESFFFRKDYLDSAEAFYEKHGGKTITISQFIPVIRTFAPVVAGMSSMNRRKFAVYNFIGGATWGCLIILLGFWLGHKVPNIDKYLLPVVILAAVFSFAPAGWHLFGKRENRQRILASIKKRVSKTS